MSRETYDIDGFGVSVVSIQSSEWLIVAKAGPVVRNAVTRSAVVPVVVARVVSVVVQVSAVVSDQSIVPIELVDVVQTVVPDRLED